MNPEIVSIELTQLYVPFKEEVVATMQSGEGGLGMAIPSEEPWLGGDFIICRMTDSAGHVGIADVFLWPPEDGTWPEHVLITIEKGLNRYILGEDPFNVTKMRRRMDNNYPRNEIAKALLENACFDLMGKITNQPACNLLGGKTVDEIPLAVLVPLTDIKNMKTYAKFFQGSGYQAFRYKLGRNIDEDIQISQMMRDTVGPLARLRVDYNQAYSPADAVRAIKAIEPYGIDYAEQPVSTYDFLGMAYVQKRVDTPLMAHEAFFSLQDFINLVELGAVGVLGVNHCRPGGLSNALKAIAYAEQRGLGVVVHDQSLGISAAMLLHLVAARYHAINLQTELFGHVMLEDDLITKPLGFKKGKVKVPEGPGWGVEIDEKALEKYATGPAIVLKR